MPLTLLWRLILNLTRIANLGFRDFKPWPQPLCYYPVKIFSCCDDFLCLPSNYKALRNRASSRKFSSKNPTSASLCLLCGELLILVFPFVLLRGLCGKG